MVEATPSYAERMKAARAAARAKREKAVVARFTLSDHTLACDVYLLSMTLFVVRYLFRFSLFVRSRRRCGALLQICLRGGGTLKIAPC